MYRLIIRANATNMAKNAYNWYEKQKEGLGDQFLDELERCYKKIKDSPVSYTNIKKDFRHILLKRFPYIVIYTIHKENVIVYSVFHTSQNPLKKFRKS